MPKIRSAVLIAFIIAGYNNTTKDNSTTEKVSVNKLNNKNMQNQNFTATILVDQSPETVFRAVTNVRGWWVGYYAEEINGNTENLHDEFTFRAGGEVHYTKHKLIEVIPNKKVVWLTTESDFNYIEKRDEWTGTKVIFEISKKAKKTELKFTHEGLTPEVECYNACAPSWTQYIHEKLLPLIQNMK